MSEGPTIAERLQRVRGLDLVQAGQVRGVVVQVGDDVASVVGLPSVLHEELLIFDSGACGMAYELGRDRVGVVLLSGASSVCSGDGVRATGQLPRLCVSEALLGRVVDPLGNPLDDGPPIEGSLCPVFREAPELLVRAAVSRPLHTGIMLIDAGVPIGRGQRQLVVGDRNVGKTALVTDIVAAQRDTGVPCVYVLIGQPISRVLSIRDALHERGALDHVAILAADASMTAGLQYLAPYAGASVAEFFRDQGKDAVVVYDDLTKHADAYRELALLLGRSPGREAFPGDIFYVHAELLERATAMNATAGGGSVTAFPLVETTDSDISGYIPTNLISITDGQIYLDTGRFERNLRPAIDVGKSVSRIGGAAQTPVVRQVAKNLRIEMTRFESLETLTRVGLDLDARSERILKRGRQRRELMRQARFTIRQPCDIALALTAVSEGWLDGYSPTAGAELVWRAGQHLRSDEPGLVARLDAGEEFPSDWRAVLQRLLKDSGAQEQTAGPSGLASSPPETDRQQ
jgi:F-type H+/Na+-transporting ATPase subunit alpha